MTQGQSRRLTGSLYLLAGLPLGVFAETVPTYLRLHSRSLTEIGFMGLVQLPWSIKFLLGPLVDRIGTPRRWLGTCIFGLTVVFCSLAAIDIHGSLTPLVAVLLGLTTISAVYDVSLDAIFLRSLEHSGRKEAAAANGLRLVAYKTAMMFGGGGLIIVGNRYGWAVGYYGLAALCGLCAALAPWGLMAAPAIPGATWRTFWSALKRWALQPGGIATVVFIFLYKACSASLAAIEKAFWVDAGVTAQTIGVAAGALGLIGSVGGALVGTWLVGRHGLQRALAVGSLAQAAAALTYWLVHVGPGAGPILWVAATATSVAFGIATAALMNFITASCESSQAATQFALLTAVYALTRATAATLSGWLAQRFGYGTFFLCAACWVPLTALALPWMRPTWARMPP
jgi:PAT family beta-lactamase induction signal transducer AmpG